MKFTEGWNYSDHANCDIFVVQQSTWAACSQKMAMKIAPFAAEKNMHTFANKLALHFGKV